VSREPLRPSAWRDAIRDSDLDRTAKLVAYTLSTYMNSEGECWPGKDLLARKVPLAKRAVDGAIARIEQGGYLLVARSLGHASNRYYATIPSLHGAAGISAAKGTAARRSPEAHPCTGPLSSLHGGASLPCTGLQAKANNESECESDSGLSSLRYDKPAQPPPESGGDSAFSEDGFEEWFAPLRATADLGNDEQPTARGGPSHNGTRPPRCEPSLVDGSLLWTGDKVEGEAGVLADLDALAAAGLGKWVEGEGWQ
jgi:hypothetical protein